MQGTATISALAPLRSLNNTLKYLVEAVGEAVVGRCPRGNPVLRGATQETLGIRLRPVLLLQARGSVVAHRQGL